MQVLNDEMFAILVLMALFTTFITTPMVMAIYKPARGVRIAAHRKLGDLSGSKVSKDALRILACVHGPSNVTSLISLIEASRSNKKSLLKLFIMHLVELTERSSSIIMVQRVRRNGFPFFNRFRRGAWHDRVSGAFQAYSQLGRVSVRPTTAVSPLATMHEDICHVAEAKRVTMIVLPFHKQWRVDGDGGEAVENVGHGWRVVNQKVLKHAPCSVAVLVDRGFGGGGAHSVRPNGGTAQHVCILFFSGPDDREALELGGRMAEHPAVKVTVARFAEREGLDGAQVILQPSPSKCRDKSYSFSVASMDRQREKELDDEAIAEFRGRWDAMAEYREIIGSNIVDEVLAVGQGREFDLVVVGKGRFPSALVAGLADRPAEHAELGPVGDILASSNNGILTSVLVIQQHYLPDAEETPMTMTKVAPDGLDRLKEGSSSSPDMQNDLV
ncbi:hypothetical protein SAY86_015413 [Trapa natans]|uniref:Cation/H(+) antiporter 20 n=1 Tax=Trapa natans TaxID=22666 RepID=A0AAN7KMZ8_TRANT|nr:hypothetical protein SAY86_015413 [Trapa natans]